MQSCMLRVCIDRETHRRGVCVCAPDLQGHTHTPQITLRMTDGTLNSYTHHEEDDDDGGDDDDAHRLHAHASRLIIDHAQA